MINLNQIIEPIEEAIIRWVQNYPLTVHVSCLLDLTNAQFFLLILQKDQSFRLIENRQFDNFTELPFSERVNRMKLIGRSIVRHYRFEMMKDLGDVHFNYVEMCLGGKEEILRLLIVLMGIIVANQQTLAEIQDYINKGQSNAYFNIMIDYARKIGERDAVFNESPIKKEKRLITKLEILEDQIEFYEEHTAELEGKIEKFVQQSQRNEKQIAEYERLSKEMIARIQMLESQNEANSKEICKKMALEQLLTLKLAKNRQIADQTVSELVSEIEKLKEQLKSAHSSLHRYRTVESLNKQLQNNYLNICSQKQQIQQRQCKSLQIIAKYQEQLGALQRMYNDLSLQNDSLKLKLSYLQKSFNSRSVYHQPQQQSIVLRHPLDISGMENNPSLNWFKNSEKYNQNDRNSIINDSLTLTIRSASEHFGEAQKQNNFNFANIPRVIGEENCFEKIAEEKSFEINIDRINQIMQMKEKIEMEQSFAIMMVDHIYEHSLELKRQLKEYQQKQAKRINRNCQFKNRVNQIFPNK